MRPTWRTSPLQSILHLQGLLIWGQDYTKTSAPTAHLESFHILAHLRAGLDWETKQLDIKSTFLHGLLDTDEVCYMEQREGLVAPGFEDHCVGVAERTLQYEAGQTCVEQDTQRSDVDMGIYPPKKRTLYLLPLYSHRYPPHRSTLFHHQQYSRCSHQIQDSTLHQMAGCRTWCCTLLPWNRYQM